MSAGGDNSISKKATDASTDLFERDSLSRQSLKDDEQFDSASVNYNEELFLQNIQEGSRDKAKDYLNLRESVRSGINENESLFDLPGSTQHSPEVNIDTPNFNAQFQFLQSFTNVDINTQQSQLSKHNNAAPELNQARTNTLASSPSFENTPLSAIEGNTIAETVIIVRDNDGNLIGQALSDEQGSFQLPLNVDLAAQQSLSLSFISAEGRAVQSVVNLSADADGIQIIDSTINDLSSTVNDVVNNDIEGSADNPGESQTVQQAVPPVIDDHADAGQVSVDAISPDNIINAAEASETINVSGTASGGDISAGDAVNFVINGADYSTTLDNDGNFSIDVAGADLAADSGFTVNVSSSDAAGNQVSSTTDVNYNVDLFGEGKIAVNAITSDDIINAEEADGYVEVSGVTSGEISAGDVVRFNVNGTDYKAEVEKDGSWSAKVSGNDLAHDSEFKVTVTGNDSAGNAISATTLSSHAVDVAVDAPVITKAVDGNTIIGTIGDNVEHLTIVVRDEDGHAISEHEAKIDGNTWSADFAKPGVGNYTMVAIAENSRGTASEVSNFVNINVGGTYESIKDTDDSINIVFDGASSNSVSTGAGDDLFSVGRGNERFDSGAGDDTFIVEGADKGYNSFTGGEGNDRIQGGDGDDVIGLSGFANSVESIDGGAGSNIIQGSTYGSLDFSETELTNIDAIRDGAGSNRVTGSQSDDTFQVNRGSDVLRGEAGDDTFIVEGADKGYNSFTGGEGNDRIQGGDGDDVIGLSGFANSVESIDGGAGSNIIQGSTYGSLDFSETKLSNIDVIRAGSGSNKIVGSQQDDNIDAGNGNDVISGNQGSDTIDGGSGNDTVVFAGNRLDYYVSQNEDGHYVIEDIRESSPDGTDTISNVENFRFSDGLIHNDALLDTNPEPPVLDNIIDGSDDSDRLISDAVNSNEQLADTAEQADDSDDASLLGSEPLADTHVSDSEQQGSSNDDLASVDVPWTSEQDINDAFTQLDVAGNFAADANIGWVNSIESSSNEEVFSADSAYADADSPWDLTVDGEELDDQLATSALEVVPDTSGVINSTEGSEVFFDETERVEW